MQSLKKITNEKLIGDRPIRLPSKMILFASDSLGLVKYSCMILKKNAIDKQVGRRLVDSHW